MEDTDSFLICDAKTRSFTIQYVSKGFQDLFGYDASECIGARCNEVFGNVKLFKDKPGMAALNKVAAELGLSDEQATAGIKRMIKAAEEAAQAASAGGSSKTVLLITSRKNGELFPCEMSLCLNEHPTTGWQYHAGLSRDVSDRISVAKLLKAASSENARCFDELCQEFHQETSRSGAGSLQEKLAAGSPKLHEIAQTVWKDELAKVFKPRDGTRAPADLRSIWSRSTASSVTSSIQSRPKRSRSESDEADEGSDKEEPWVGIPHLGAFFSQCQGGVSSEAPPAVEGPAQTEVVRGLRLLRLARALRMVGRLKVIWRLVYGLITAGQTMFSTTLLIGLVLFICGCVAVEIITKNKDFCRDPTSETCQVVHKHFADLGTSILTLVQFVTLDSIAEVYFPIIVQQPLLLVFFLPILMFVSITLMNLITAVLVENALEFAAHEAEAERIKTKQRVKEALPRLLEIFNEIDEDASGCVTHDEIEKVSVDVLPPRLLETVSVDSMTDLFELLDVDGSGRLTRGEFVEGLLNLVLMDVPIWTIQSLKLLRLIRGQTLKLDEELASLKASLSKDEGAI